MTLFYKIITKLLERSTIISPYHTLYKVIFFYFSVEPAFKPMYIDNLDSNKFKSLIKNKYGFLKNILDNPFYDNQLKEEIIEHFCQGQRTYFAFTKFVNQYRYKRAKIMMDCDLCLNPIEKTQKNRICLLQNGNRYFFITSDLINVIITALTYSPNFFSSPLVIKNPFNNVPFSKSNLYNIYFTLFFRAIPIPEIIQKFFHSDFDLDVFERENEELIREYSIKSFIKNSSNHQLNLYRT
jgi:hypothetical protein